MKTFEHDDAWMRQQFEVIGLAPEQMDRAIQVALGYRDLCLMIVEAEYQLAWIKRGIEERKNLQRWGGEFRLGHYPGAPHGK